MEGGERGRSPSSWNWIQASPLLLDSLSLPPAASGSLQLHVTATGPGWNHVCGVCQCEARVSSGVRGMQGQRLWDGGGEVAEGHKWCQGADGGGRQGAQGWGGGRHKPVPATTSSPQLPALLPPTTSTPLAPYCFHPIFPPAACLLTAHHHHYLPHYHCFPHWKGGGDKLKTVLQ